MNVGKREFLRVGRNFASVISLLLRLCDLYVTDSGAKTEMSLNAS